MASRMTQDVQVGCLGLGMFLPPEVRSNDWWSPEVVASWAPPAAPPPAPPASLTEGMARVLKALGEQAVDPFRGAVARHVMSSGMTALDMEEAAAREAITRSGIDPAKIDLVLTHTVLPDVLLGNQAAALHQRLGLQNRCFAMPNDAAAHSYMMQFSIAEAMIASGRATYALLVQSSATSRMVDWNDSWAPLFGDGATATVVGPVSEGRGIKASVHFTDGRFNKTLVGSVPGGTWHDEGRGLVHVEDTAMMREVFLRTADVCKQALDAALEAAGVAAAEIDFFAMYQGTPWLRPVVQKFAGLDNARSLETFAQTGYLFSATIPASIYLADKQGMLSADDLVLVTGGGTGLTYGSLVLRWGS